MINMESVVGRPADSINEKGVKFWLDRDLTMYSIKKNKLGIELPNIQVLILEEPNGHATRIIVDSGSIIYENQSIEGIAIHIDMMKASMHFDKIDADKSKKQI